MPSLHLTPDQASVLTAYLERALTELDTEIAATDTREFRAKVKAERKLLGEVLDQLTSTHQWASADGG